jgi:hypothetical protein
MKKLLTILLLFFFNCTFFFGQTWMKTDIPCSKELLLKTPGAWLGVGKGYSAKLTKQELLQVESRLNTIHEWVRAIHPSPMAFDASTGYFTDDMNFAAQLKIETLPNGRMNTIPGINGIPTTNYSYSTMFCSYHCGRNVHEIMRGRGCEAGSVVAVFFNSLTPLFFERTPTDYDAEFMRIDGRPIKMTTVRPEKWKGYDVYSPQAGSGNRFVLICRNGMLPYIPVTRKQYLERSIKCLEFFFDKNIKVYDEFGALMDKKTKDENIKIQQQQKDEAIKHYRDELEATTKAGLLDSPAITPGISPNPVPNFPIFITSEAGGFMLVTENPAYIKKELPKYIPQLIILRMWNRGDGPDPALNPYHIYYKDFPIEKLQAMIDK